MQEWATAKAWGVRQFFDASEDEQAYMIAYEESVAEMNAVDEFLREEKARKDSQKNKPRGRFY